MTHITKGAMKKIIPKCSEKLINPDDYPELTICHENIFSHAF